MPVASRRVHFSSADFPAHAGAGVFPVVAACNHSCAPNCEVAFLGDATAVLFATRDIEAEEEITIAYVDTTQPVEVRRAALMRRYGFACVCSKCLSDTAEAEQTCPPCKRQKVAAGERLAEGKTE